MNNIWNRFALFFFLLTNSLILNLSLVVAQEQLQESSTKSTEEIRKEFGNWLQVCERDVDHCVAVQFALDVQGRKAARFILDRLTSTAENPADSLITFFIPFESSVPLLLSGVSFAVDSNEPFTEQFLYCDQLGCTAQFGMTDKGIDLLKQGANLTIQIIDIREPNSRYIVDLDLDKFVQIYEELKPKDSS
ncbi:MAG: invasion associated locus B family protein [Paracoccaceae bacterium]|nr:invasion associated locus B family protein [Paracoccaceae bacterium]